MILVCVGASEYSFDRLLSIIDDLCDDGTIQDKVIAQVGSSKYVARNYQTFSLIGRDKFQDYLQNADVVITHAGTGSVVPPLKMRKKVIVFPRREKYKEHLDDHQLELADVFNAAGFTLCANNIDELRIAIKNISAFKPKQFESNTKKMNDLIIDYIEKNC